MIAGMGLRRAERLKAAVELGRRVAAERSRDVVDIASSDDVERLMRPLVDALPYEECWALYLTSSNRVIERMRVSQGGVQATVVDHRLIVKRALELLSTQIILGCTTTRPGRPRRASRTGISRGAWPTPAVCST